MFVFVARDDLMQVKRGGRGFSYVDRDQSCRPGTWHKDNIQPSAARLERCCDARLAQAWLRLSTSTEENMKRAVLAAGLIVLIGALGTAYAAGDAAAGKAKAASCASCHGANGQGSGDNPKLAGKPEAELAQALQEFKAGKRSNTMMKSLARRLSDQDIANLAAYYSSLK
jgi:cytochrome c553